MSEQIEQLKSDKAALEAAQLVMRKHCGYVSELAEDLGFRIQNKIKELEKQSDDPWQDAKEHLIAMELPLSATYWQNVVAKYVRHLEEKVKGLESQSEHKPLWAVIPSDEHDSEARARGVFNGAKYRLFFTKEDALKLAGDSKNWQDKWKVIPVWGE